MNETNENTSEIGTGSVWGNGELSAAGHSGWNLYIWTDGVVVVARSVNQAREIAAQRLTEFPAACAIVQSSEPTITSAPGVRLLFRTAMRVS
jgi:hypothetical protein